MTTITQMIPDTVLRKFLQQQMPGKQLVVAVSGPHAYGYAHPSSPLELKGLHVEPTENLVGLSAPPKSHNWVGEYDGYRIDYSSLEIGEAFSRLLRGDGSILERVMAARQLIKGEDLRKLQKGTRGVICRRFFSHYRNFARGMTRVENGERRSVRHILGVYRTALTGIHLFKTGKVLIDLMELARIYHMTRVKELVRVYQQDSEAVVLPDSPWLNRVAKLHTLLEEAVESSRLPADPENPKLLEDYLLDMRRRFFDAPTVRS